MKVIITILLVIAALMLIQLFKPRFLNPRFNEANKTAARIISSIVLLVSITVSAFMWNIDTNKVDSTSKQNIQTKNTAAQEPDDEPLAGDPKELVKLKPHRDFMLKIVASIEKEYQKQKSNYNPVEWASFIKETRAKIDVDKTKFEKELPLGKVSPGNNDKVDAMTYIYSWTYTDFIKNEWDDLDNKPNELDKTKSELLGFFKQLSSI